MAWTRIDRGTGQVEAVSEEEVVERVGGYYLDVAAAIAKGKEGIPIKTSFAYYEYREEE